MVQPAAPNQNTEIRVEGLHKAFEGNRVLCGIDLTIYRGDFVAIVGGSGCGKTVLLNHMLGLLTPDRGKVLVSNYGKENAPLISLDDASQTEIDQIHTHWGVVFQGNALFSGTVYDNLALWLDEVRHMEDGDILLVAQKVLEAVALPFDEEFLQTETHSLSGGMAKRLAVARAMAMSPHVLFHDEPTTGLDPTSASQIHELLFKSHEEIREKGQTRTTIVITHDKDLLSRLAPRTVMIHEGTIHFDGPFADFEASNSPIIRPYFEQMHDLHFRAAE